MSKLKIGSLCTGYGGLDMAVEAYFNAETVWSCEIDKHASQVIDQRFHVPNYGNLIGLEDQEIEFVDIITAGYPCQPFSQAGHRKGSLDERHIWPFIKNLISRIKPKFVILENVRGHLSLGFKEVLADLTSIGYDARWEIVRASDIGAPHQRARLFVIAYPIDYGCSYWNAIRSQPPFPEFENDGCLTDTNGHAHEESRRTHLHIPRETREIIDRADRNEHRFSLEMDRQEVPDPLVEGKLNARFVEYMMGLPSGWVTDLIPSRAHQLKMLGNGVVPQQAFHALELMLGVKE